MELIRPVALFLLLFCGVAVGAEAERRQAEPCANGNTHQAGFCPAVLSSASCSATGATTGSCSATSDEADGTRYVCATSNNTALTGAQIEACSGGAAIAGSSAAETGSNSVSLSGLTTDAAHYGQIVNESPEGWYSNRLVSSSFTPVASGDPWDIWGARSTPAAFAALAWPTEPTTSTSGTYSSLSALNTAISGGAIDATLQAGSYSGTLNLSNATDVKLTLTGATITGGVSFTSSTARIEIQGGRINITGEIYVDGADVRFNNVHINKTGGSGGLLNMLAPMRRFAATNSTFTLDSGSGTLFTFSGPEDVIFAGCDFDNNVGGGSSFGIRFQSIDRLVVVDSRTAIAGTNQNFRIHSPNNQDMNGVYIARNQIEEEEVTISPDIGSATTGYIRNLYFYDNNLYHPSGLSGFAPIQIGLQVSGSNVENLNFADNTDYTTDVGGGIINNGSGVALSEDSNNVKASYSSIPAFAYGSNQ